jgi:hypothetical protein
MGRADLGSAGPYRRWTLEVGEARWLLATQERIAAFAWVFWTFDWGTPGPGEHRISSRAFDADGNIQPAPDAPFLASNRTFWESNGQITRRVLIP